MNLSGLYELLHNTLLITERAKEILRRDCEEAAFVLKPWQMKTIVEKRTDENICNCKKNEDEAEEIAAGIGRAIMLAQELREKLKLNVASRKKVSRKDTVENIYLSNSIQSSKKVLKKNVATQNTNTTKSPDCKRSNTHKNDKVTSVVTKRSVNTKQNNALDKMQPKVSSAKVAEKSKKRKNFILNNKLNIKKISSANKPQINDNNPNNILQNSRKSLSPEASATELSDLIHKMTRQSTESALISSKNIESDCPIHGCNRRESVQEQIVVIDVVEALRHFNVPNDIVKVLRIYHAFLKTEADNLSDIKEDRYKKSVDTFRKEFEAMNIAMQDYLLKEPYLLKKAAKSITTFSSILSEDSDSFRSNDINTELEDSFKLNDTKNIAESIKENPFCNFSLARGWISNGIWNISCMKHFKNFSKAYNIKYCNKKQLLSLYGAIQKLQRTKYFNILIEIILRDVIPTIKFNIEPTSAEYAQAYKTIFILYQGLSPEVPALVRTDG